MQPQVSIKHMSACLAKVLGRPLRWTVNDVGLKTETNILQNSSQNNGNMNNYERNGQFVS